MAGKEIQEMILRTTPMIWPAPVTLIGTRDQQLEAARKACLIAYGEHVRAVRITLDDGRVIGGRPLDMITALHPRMWDQ